MEYFRTTDIQSLLLLGPSTEQNHQRFAVLGEINSVAWSPIDSVFTYAFEPFDV